MDLCFNDAEEEMREIGLRPSAHENLQRIDKAPADPMVLSYTCAGKEPAFVFTEEQLLAQCNNDKYLCEFRDLPTLSARSTVSSASMFLTCTPRRMSWCTNQNWWIVNL